VLSSAVDEYLCITQIISLHIPFFLLLILFPYCSRSLIGKLLLANNSLLIFLIVYPSSKQCCKSTQNLIKSTLLNLPHYKSCNSPKLSKDLRQTPQRINISLPCFSFWSSINPSAFLLLSGSLVSPELHILLIDPTLVVDWLTKFLCVRVFEQLRNYQTHLSLVVLSNSCFAVLLYHYYRYFENLVFFIYKLCLIRKLPKNFLEF
jgi:hypothetical protein